MSLSFKQGHITIKIKKLANETNGLKETEHHRPGVIVQDS